MTEAKEKGGSKKTGGLGKVILDTSCLQASGGGGGCPVEKVLYVIFLATGWSLLSTDSNYTMVHCRYSVRSSCGRQRQVRRDNDQREPGVPQ